MQYVLTILISFQTALLIGKELNNVDIKCNIKGPLWTNFSNVELKIIKDKCIVSGLNRGRVPSSIKLSKERCVNSLKDFNQLLFTENIIFPRYNPRQTYVDLSWTLKSTKNNAQAQFLNHLVCNSKGVCKKPPMAGPAVLCLMIIRMLEQSKKIN